MRMLRTLAVIVAVVLLSGPLSAHPNIIYNWTGDCTRVFTSQVPLCTHAALHVVVPDTYVPGTTVTPAVMPALIEALYTDDIAMFDFTFPWPVLGELLLLPATLPGEGEVRTFVQDFQAMADGTWRYNGESTLSPPFCGELHNPFCGYHVEGINGVWTRVPAPSTLVLVGVGFGSLAFYRRRSLRP